MNAALLRTGAGVLSAVSVAIAVASLAAMPSGTRERLVVPRHRVDLATAPIAELALLPEVGTGLAARIARDRAVRGAFTSIEDVARVPGVGDGVMASLRDHARAGAPRGRR